MLAWSAGLTARDEEMLATQERVYQARLDTGENLAAGRAAFWLRLSTARTRASRPGPVAGCSRAQRLRRSSRAGLRRARLSLCCRPGSDI